MGDADRQFLKITFVRDPLEHIISHLRFAEHYSRPELEAAYDGMLSPEVRDVVDRLARVDFACSEAIADQPVGPRRRAGITLTILKNSDSKVVTISTSNGGFAPPSSRKSLDWSMANVALRRCAPLDFLGLHKECVVHSNAQEHCRPIMFRA